MKKHETGFTIIELIVSLVLVGIMASVAGMGIVAGVRGYLFAKDNAAISGKAQLAMSRLTRTFMEVLDITTVGTSPTRVTYNRLSGGISTQETLYLDTTDHTIKIAAGGNPSGGDILVDHVSSLALTYQKGAATWVQGTDDFYLLSAVGVTLVLTRPDGGSNATFSTVVTPRNNGNLGGDPMPSTPPNPSSTGCFVATAAFGHYDHPMVLLLREFRDQYLLTWAGGRMIVRAYYAGGPYLADLIRDRVWACILIQWLLLPFAGMAFLLLYTPQAVPFIFLFSWIAVRIFSKFIRRRQKMIAFVPVNQRGAILLALIGTMVIFSVLGAAMLSFVNSSTFNQVTSTGSTRAYYLAEGGMRYAGSQFKNAGTDEHIKDNMLESLNGHDFSMGSDGTFHLDVYPYYLKTTAVPSGTTLSTKYPGTFPLTPYSLPASGYLKIGNTDTTPRYYSGYTRTGSNVNFTMSPALTGFTAAVNNVLPVGQASATTLNRLGTLTLSSGAAAFPPVNGTFTIGTTASTTGSGSAMTGLPNGLANVVFAYKTRNNNTLQGITLSQAPNQAFTAAVPGSAYITLMKFVNVRSRGTYTPLQASRTISYSVPIGFVQAQGSDKAKLTDTFEDLSNWTWSPTGASGEIGTHEIQAVADNSALHVKSTYDVTLLGLLLVSRQSLVTLKWIPTLNQSWALADHLLSYDTQVKVRANSQDYYAIGITTRVDSLGQMYGVSFLRANKEGVSDRDGIPDAICPTIDDCGWLSCPQPPMIVLWQQTPANTVRWLAYKTLTTADGVVDNNKRLVDWSTLVVRVIEADALQFNQGGPGTTGTLRYGDIITGATSGATATINGTPILTSGDWASHNAAGWLTVSNVTKSGGAIQFQSGENLTVAGVVRARYTGTSRQKDNYIRVYYGRTANLGTANANPLDNNRSGYARLAINGEAIWPKDDVVDWAAANDYFTLVQWNDNLNLDGGDTRLGTGSELNAIIRTDALTTPSSGTFTGPEVGLDTWGSSSTYVFFDDFGIQTLAPGQTQGFLPAIQQ